MRGPEPLRQTRVAKPLTSMVEVSGWLTLLIHSAWHSTVPLRHYAVASGRNAGNWARSRAASGLGHQRLGQSANNDLSFGITRSANRRGLFFGGSPPRLPDGISNISWPALGGGGGTVRLFDRETRGPQGE